MAGRFRYLQIGFATGLVAALIFSFISPFAAYADTNLVVGGTAKIAYANGDNVRFRSEPGYDGEILGRYPEGTSVYVESDWVEDSDGNIWYEVTIGDTTGYIIADYLSLDSGAALDVEDSGSDDTGDSGVAAAGSVIATGYIANSNGDGVRCRVSPTTSSAIIMVIPQGDAVGLTGSAQNGWQPAECDGKAGWIAAQFISYDAPVADVVTTADDTDVVITAETTGSAIVDANGDGLRCRAKASSTSAILTVVRDGATVDLRGSASDGWQPVLCAGQTGFMSAQYLVTDVSDSDDDASGVGAEVTVAATGQGTISGTNGDGVRCRSSASTSASTITVLNEGVKVDLRGAAQGSWQPVICSGQNGYVHTDYISTGGSSSADDDSGGSSVTGTATVVNTAGGLNCRATASMTGAIIGYFKAGSTVELRGAASGVWQPVFCSGKSGYAHSDYLSTGSSSGGSSGGSNSSFATGAKVEVDGTNGTGVRLRSSASMNGSVLMIVGEGKECTVRAGSSGDWVAVSYNGTNGFIHMDYLTASTGGSSSSGGGGGSADALSKSDHARVTEALKLRYDASTSAGVAAVAPAGTVVLITGGSSNGFYPVDWDGLKGFMHGDYLAATSSALSERGGSGTPGTTTSPPATGGSATGNALVNYAMRYLGYPYVWATHGPSSFDCSGFTSWVAKNVLGIDIGYGTWTQANSGVPVSRANLQPGDIVLFQNTYKFGLSHVGMYIGNNKFIHAQNEATGVVISDLNSNYYGSRWYGARRLV